MSDSSVSYIMSSLWVQNDLIIIELLIFRNMTDPKLNVILSHTPPSQDNISSLSDHQYLENNILPHVRGCRRSILEHSQIDRNENCLCDQVDKNIKLMEVYLRRMNLHQEDYNDVRDHIEHYLNQLKSIREILYNVYRPIN